ncbi:hypothetical protein FC34_GL001058 [Lacticaseibacillus brantae DSM 23927]|uniref:Uncharacterized protein n=1 Tax=Lacticaseibacillus brantae DSM 23927 TaxID=1423727 RepID=A0A0R2AZ09_9LACO|nr:hypothetical protein FC34_GL001058 [Lacticaseibacillus brantae DSM 23927]
MESEKALLVPDPDDKKQKILFSPTMQLLAPLYHSPNSYPKNLTKTDVDYLKGTLSGKEKAVKRLNRAIKIHFEKESSRIQAIPDQPHLKQVMSLAADGINAIPKNHWYDLGQALANFNSSGHSINFRLQVQEATNAVDFELESFLNDVLDYLVVPDVPLPPYYMIGEISDFNEYAIEQFLKLEDVLPILDTYQDELDKLWNGDTSKLTKESAGEYFNQLTIFMGAVTTAFEQQPKPL